MQLLAKAIMLKRTSPARPSVEGAEGRPCIRGIFVLARKNDYQRPVLRSELMMDLASSLMP